MPKKVIRSKNYDLQKQKLDSAKIWPPRFWNSGSASAVIHPYWGSFHFHYSLTSVLHTHSSAR